MGPPERAGEYAKWRRRHGRRTVDALALGDNLAEGHRVPAVLHEVREDAGSEGNLLVEVTLCKAVVAELKLGRRLALEVGVEDAERVQVGDMVAADLVCAHEKLGLSRRSALALRGTNRARKP
jgi:hypothetical protein